MITIISGTPGSGKTALIVDMIMIELREGRKVFTYGIPKLLLNVLQAGDPKTWQEGGWLQIDRYDPVTTKLKGISSTWMPRGCPSACPYLSTCPKIGVERPDSGSLIIVDEAHTEFPQRSSGSKIPPYIDALSVHRHQGLDFWFISQRPSFLDPFIRGLCSRHLHISLNAFSFNSSRNLYEWTEYQETVNRTSKLLSSKRSYKPSPAVFPLYHSATLHTKLEQKMPTILKTFIVSILVLLLIVGFLVHRASERIKQLNTVTPSLSISSASSVPLTPAFSADTGGQRSGQTVGGANAPVHDPWSPPAPVANISACISNDTKCSCYTKNGVPVLLLDDECRRYAKQPSERFDFNHNNQPISPMNYKPPVFNE
jgi:Zonular occludens toxin (Zot)